MKKLKLKQGFTLIEIMVATSIFMIVMLAAMGGLLTASASAKKARALRSAMDNVNYAMDSMSRSLRLGSTYDCTTPTANTFPSTGYGDCPIGRSAIRFIPAATSAQPMIAFQKVDNLLFAPGKGTVQKCDPTSCVNMTAPEVDVTDLRFSVLGSQAGDGIQPSVFILMRGKITLGTTVTEFALQTLASQRNAE